jgi:putative transposase
LVFVTTYRRGVFDDAMLGRCEQVIREVCADVGAELREFNGAEDHVHPLVHHPPTIAVSRLVNSLEGVSSLHLRAESTSRINRARTHGHLWSPSNVAASSGAAPYRSSRTTSLARNDPTRKGFLPALKDGASAPDRW